MFFHGATPIMQDMRNLDDMILDEAREFLNIKDNKETRLSANARGNQLQAAGDRIFLNTQEPKPDQVDKLHYTGCPRSPCVISDFAK
jgi:hypothetical protein